MRAATPLYPRPSLRSGYAVPVHQHSCDPIRPTRRHSASSLLCSLYALSSLYVSAWRPATASVLSLLVLSQHVALCDSGEFRLYAPSSFTANAGLRPFSTDSPLPYIPQIRFTRGAHFGASLRSLALQPADLFTLLTDQTGFPSSLRDFYYQAFTLVTPSIAVIATVATGISTGGTYTR